jgi:iron(III) transport system substrate-binding protein
MPAATSSKMDAGIPADLVVYTPHPDDQVSTIVDEFRERTGLRVRVVRDGTGALLERLRRPEGREADVLWGGGAESLVANIDLFQPYESPERAFIPASLRDAEGYWTGLTVLPMVIIVNSKLVPEASVPRTWADLAKPVFTGSVAYADPATSGSAYTILRTMLVASRTASGFGTRSGDDAAWRQIEGFVAGIGGEPLAESSLVYRAVAAGEYLVGATYENAGAEAQRLGSDVRIVYPEDGTSAVPDGVAVIRGSAHLEAARRFVDFVLGADVARIMAAKIKRRSARTDSPVPDGVPPLESVRLLDYDFDAAVSERSATLERFKSLTEKY